MALRGVWDLRGVYESTPNVKPIASISSQSTARVGQTITLVGEVFDANSEDTHSYRWRISFGSNKAILLSEEGQSVGLTLTGVGRVSIGLVVNDGREGSLEVIQDIDSLAISSDTSLAVVNILGIPNGIYIANFTFKDTGGKIQRKFITFEDGYSTTSLAVPVGTEYDVSIKNDPITHYTGREGVTT